MWNVTVYAWRDQHPVALFSVTDRKFLADLEEWINGQEEYRIEVRERNDGRAKGFS